MMSTNLLETVVKLLFGLVIHFSGNQLLEKNGAVSKAFGNGSLDSQSDLSNAHCKLESSSQHWSGTLLCGRRFYQVNSVHFSDGYELGSTRLEQDV